MDWYGGVFHNDVPFAVPVARTDRHWKRMQDQKLVVRFEYDRREERLALTEALEQWLQKSALSASMNSLSE